MKHSAIGMALAFLVQIGLVGWFVAERARVLVEGTEIRLEVVPVDPRDLLRGHYVILAYDISRVQSDALAGDDEFNRGDAIHVTVEQDAEGGWQATAINHVRPTDGMVLKGVVVTTLRSRDGSCASAAECRNYTVAYNLEQLFVPQETARALERLRRDQVMTVDVAVATDGRAALKRLLVDGEVRYEEGLF